MSKAKKTGTLILLFVVSFLLFTRFAEASPLRVSSNGRFLVWNDGTPFFWLMDSAQALLTQLSREDVDLYLEIRANFGFTVIETNVMSFIGYNAANVYGDVPFIDGDPTRPNEPFWQHVDYVVNKAASLGLVIALVPDRQLVIIGDDWRAGPLNESSAYEYGRFVGQRYRGKPIVWILAWDVQPKGREAVFTAVADGIADGSGGGNHNNVLITFHTSPTGYFIGHSSSYFFNQYHWLDFNSVYSSHRDDNESYGFPEAYSLIEADYFLSPARPVVDMEPPYESVFDGIFDGRGSNGPRMGADVIRRKAYWSVFAGAFGFAFGNIDIVTFHKPGQASINGSSQHWKDALFSPASMQMQYLRKLIESRCQLIQRPDQSMIVSDVGSGQNHIRATRASDGSYAFVYVPDGRSVSINTSSLGERFAANWFDPRNGSYIPIGQFINAEMHAFDPPGTPQLGNDWVLVLDSDRSGGGTVCRSD